MKKPVPTPNVKVLEARIERLRTESAIMFSALSAIAGFPLNSNERKIARAALDDLIR